ncbi:MAG TPA: exodeoxyribonuclease V subunit gamma [Desulfosarcina sp.]|nr:exodeoxyribonuclease V subunit gamma [Desulfosarcina sp.]
MGTTLYFSNQLMPLADKLAADLLPENTVGGWPDPPVVVVPNMNLSKWIKLTLAEKNGIFMHVQFEFLEAGLWKMLRSLDRRPGAPPQLADRNDLTTLIFFILMNADMQTPDLQPLDRYLDSSSLTNDVGREIRCWQLAGQLAFLFQEYEYHRADMIRRWMGGHPAEDPVEACQQWIYREMRTLKDRLGSVIGRNLGSMAEYAAQLMSGDAGRRSGVPERIHFFGMSQISPLHLQVLSQLNACFDIHIYSLNPSREYWEDVQTPVEKRWVHRRAVSRLAVSADEAMTGDLFSPVDHELLSAWGKPGRESIRLLCQLTDYDFQAGFSAPPRPDTVLGAIASSMLTLESRGGASMPLSQDASLQIVACPGIRREVETVYYSILHNLENDPDLCLTDIAVMVSDMSRYKPIVDSVFDRQPHRIAYNLVDSQARTESVLAQAVLALMALARGNFSRKQVFDLLRNPCVMQRWDYGPDTLSIWIAWTDALGIFHDYENPTGSDDECPAAGCYSWRQGLERMRLARIMTVPDAVGDTTGLHYHGLVPYADLNTGNERILGKFCRLVEALAAAMRRLAMTSATAAAWRDALFSVVEQFIEIGPHMRGEEAVYQSLVQAFDHFILYDALSEVREGRPLTADALWVFVRTRLEGISGGQGDYLTGGVTVSGLMPMRPIPFKVVYVLGLEEGRFPGRVDESLLDLRNRRRRIGDISPAERDRYLFLEILISVRTKLYLCYVSRDLQKDRELAPCAVLHQLRRFVERQVMGGAPFKVCRIPAKADSPVYLETDAVNRWSDAMAGGCGPVHRLSSYRRYGLWTAFADRATDAQLASAARYHPHLALPERSPENATDVLALSIGTLKRFLLDPVAAVAEHHLDVGERIDPHAESADQADEPFFSPFPVDFEIRTVPVDRWMTRQLADAGGSSSGPSLEAVFDTVYADLHRKSRVPSGAFAGHEKAGLKKDVLAVGNHLEPFIERMRSARQLYPAAVVGAAVGNGAAGGRHALDLDPVTIDLADTAVISPPVSVRLEGSLPWLWQDDDSSWHCLTVTGSDRKAGIVDKYVLGPLLGLMAIAAGKGVCPWSGAGRVMLHTVYRSRVFSLAHELDPAECRSYYIALLEDFLNPWPLVWLPFETVAGRKAWRSLIAADAVSDAAREAFRRSMAEAMQEAADGLAELTGAVVTDDILDRARRRFRGLME